MTMADEMITLTEVARRLNLDLGGISKWVRRAGIPVTPGKGSEKFVSWQAVCAVRAPDGYVSVSEVMKRIGIRAHSTLNVRAADRGVEILHPGNTYTGWIRECDIETLRPDRFHRAPLTDGLRRCTVCDELIEEGDAYPTHPGAHRACHNRQTHARHRTRMVDDPAYRERHNAYHRQWHQKRKAQELETRCAPSN